MRDRAGAPGDVAADALRADTSRGAGDGPPDGLRPGPLHALRSGRDPGEARHALVLLHGFGATSRTWDPWLPALEARGHVVRIDLKGFGGSPKPTDGRYDPEEQARLVVETIGRLGLGPGGPADAPRPALVPIGHSFGGSVALLAAMMLADAGAPPAGLVVVAGPAFRQRLPPFVRLARHPEASAALMRGLGARLIVGQVFRSVVYDPGIVTSEMIERYASGLDDAASVRGLLRCAGQVEPQDVDRLTARYPSLDVPTLLLWGRHDRVVPLHVGQRLARALPRATLRVLDRCGHVPQEEMPERSLAEVEAFLESLGR